MLRHLSFLSFFIFHFSFISLAQQDSCNFRLSLLTCTPGEELYSTFGHSALRLTDTLKDEDIVFNYGTFNFEEPGFYAKFIRGKLTFYLSIENFTSFIQFYKEEKRGIIEQVLNLSCSEKKHVVELLRNNLNGTNKFYKYDFTFDNCTTRLRDLVENTADSTVYFSKIIQQKTSFRDLIYEYLNYNDKQWSKLGIDILLGAKTDAVMNNRQAMFLPDYLMTAFDSSHLGEKKLVSVKSNLYHVDLEKSYLPFYEKPFFVFSCFLLLIVFLSLSKNHSIQNFLSGFDGFLFFVTGLLGILLLFMWFGTDHKMCSNNYNLLWALPSQVIAAFFVHSNKRNATLYFKLTVLINIIVLATWSFLPQHLNISLIPVVILLTFRSAAAGFQLTKR